MILRLKIIERHECAPPPAHPNKEYSVFCRRTKRMRAKRRRESECANFLGGNISRRWVGKMAQRHFTHPSLNFVRLTGLKNSNKGILISAGPFSPEPD